MSHPTQAEILRITIALAALRFKPLEQSYHAYLADLRAKFPLEAQGSTEHDIWRERAVQLEQNLKELQIKYDNEHIELLSLREAQPRPAPQAAEEPPAPAGNKKKQKKKVPSAEPLLHPKPVEITLQTVLNGAEGAARLPPGPSTQNVLALLETVDHLLKVQSTGNTTLPGGLFLATVSRAIDALGALFVSVVPPNQTASSSVGILEALTTLAPRLLAAVVPLLAKGGRTRKTKASESPAVIDDVLGRLATALVVPLLRSFALLSRSHLSALLSPEKNSKKRAQANKRRDTTDIRAEVFALLQAITSTLDELATNVQSCATSIHNVNHFLILEVVRALQSLYKDSCASHNGAHDTASTACARLPPVERLERLIRKDTLWYLCNALHLLLPTPPSSQSLLPHESDEPHRLLEEAVYTGLSALLRDTRARARRSDADADERGHAASDGAAEEAPGVGAGRGAVMGEVERGMVLAVVERVWLAL